MFDQDNNFLLPDNSGYSYHLLTGKCMVNYREKLHINHFCDFKG